MRKIRLGKTGLTVTKTAFGALPAQRLSMEDAVKLLRNAYESGINFFDTARAYSDSEAKLGAALSDVRHNIIIATKTQRTAAKEALEELDTSLKTLKTDYIDIYQLHNPPALPDKDEPGGLYEMLLAQKKAGKIRHIGITNHRVQNAAAAVKSGMFETLQFPLSYLSSDEDLALISLCREKDIGVIAMKAMSGGLITNPAASFAFLSQFDNVAPIFGIQRQSELEDFIRLEKDPPVLDEAMKAVIANDRKELSGNFCRGCGYCMPCPQGIHISWCARMRLLLRRSPYQRLVTPEWQAEMAKIDTCLECGQCTAKCPYELDTPRLLKENLADYRDFVAKL